MNKFLVVDNDDVFRSRLAPWLNERGWSLVDAPDGRSGVELALQHEPKIVLCDLLTPRLQRPPVLPRLAQAARGQRLLLPDHLAAGSGNVADKMNALEAGADEYLVKPVSFQTLDKFLARFVAGVRQGSGNGAASGAETAPAYA